eukprot:1334353-Rhodomonas_salina.1
MRLVPASYPSWRFVPSLCPPVFPPFLSPAAPLSLVAAPAWRCGTVGRLPAEPPLLFPSSGR